MCFKLEASNYIKTKFSNNSWKPQYQNFGVFTKLQKVAYPEFWFGYFQEFCKFKIFIAEIWFVHRLNGMAMINFGFLLYNFEFPVE